jgi:hypothetical protein
LQRFLAARQIFEQSVDQAAPSYRYPTSKTQAPASRAAQRQYEIAMFQNEVGMWFSMQPIDSMARDRKAVPCLRDGVGDRRSALVGVGKEAVSTNQCKKVGYEQESSCTPNREGINHKKAKQTRCNVGSSPMLV